MTPFEMALFMLGLVLLGAGILIGLIEWNGIRIWIAEQQWAESERPPK